MRLVPGDRGGDSLDVQEIDGATHNGVEQVRELRESARYNPARDRFKIWIIDEVHMLSTGAFNALLKTLEEPPPRVKFVFATTEYHKLPDTILSRCQQYDFRLIPAARAAGAPARRSPSGEQVKVSDEALGRIARAAEGSARDALSLFDQVLSFSGERGARRGLSARCSGLIDRELLLAASRAVAAGDSLALLELVERLSDYGADYRNFARELLLHFREILLLKLAPRGSALLAALTPEERERVRPLAAAFSEEDLLRVLEVLTEADTELRPGPGPARDAGAGAAEARAASPPGALPELVERVERLAGGAAAPRAARGAGPRRPPRARHAAAPAPAPARRPRRAGGARPARPAPAAATASVAASLDRHARASPRRRGRRSPSRCAARRRARRATRSCSRCSPTSAALAAMHVDEYRELARKAGGRPLKVRIGAGRGGARAAAALARRRRRERRLTRRGRARARGAGGPRPVRRQVVDVREAKPS